MKTSYFFATTILAAGIALAGCGAQQDEPAKEKTEKTEQTSSNHQHDHKELTGKFKSGAEEVSGDVKIKDNKIMLTNFKSAKGPDLFVYLTKDGDIKGGKQLDAVDYNKATQTFDTKGADLDKYNEVTIYCKKAHVTFGSAPVK